MQTKFNFLMANWSVLSLTSSSFSCWVQIGYTLRYREIISLFHYSVTFSQHWSIRQNINFLCNQSLSEVMFAQCLPPIILLIYGRKYCHMSVNRKHKSCLQVLGWDGCTQWWFYLFIVFAESADCFEIFRITGFFLHQLLQT